jgi:riboflavin kinase / FMN adenylyltransferase
MQIFHSLDEVARQSRPSTVTVGSFDGIHCAHSELLRRVRERARQQGSASVAVTFDPHPVAVLAPDKAPRMLTPLPIKLELLERSGIDRLLVLPFTLEFSRWSPAQFVERVLVKTLRAETVFVGENFHFGHRQAGNPQVLKKLGEQLGFRTEILEKMVLRKKIVSSSQIRLLVEQGKITLANRLLGHPFSIRGSIQAGLGIGSTRTVPTLNLDAAASLVPQRGVYISRARLSSEKSSTTPADFFSAPFPSVTNVGTRPTFGERELGVETHLLESWSGDNPGLLDVSFLYRLRDERMFDSAESLKEQIKRDVQRAQKYFRQLQRAGISIP